MKLYVTYTSPYARLARILVIEKNLEDRIEIIKAKTRTADSPYYEINPSGRVPYLVDDAGVGIEDSQLICAYLDSLDGKPRFHDPLRKLDWDYLRLEFMARSMCDVRLKQARLWVTRSKNGLSVEHPIPGDELRAIKRYLATREDQLPWLFISERGQPMTRQAVNYLIGEAGRKAKLERVHPHKLRHSCGYYLANQGVDLRTMQDYLGHRDPRHTVLYTRVAGRRFEGLWK